MKAYELISTSVNFARGNFSINAEKQFTNPAINPENGQCFAEKWDICGALQHCYPYNKSRFLLDELEKEILTMKDEKGVRLYNSWQHFNDNSPYAIVVQTLQLVENKFNLKNNED